jgi:hypothetical protein
MLGWVSSLFNKKRHLKGANVIESKCVEVNNKDFRKVLWDVQVYVKSIQMHGGLSRKF